jgi:hypothetical protein
MNNIPARPVPPPTQYDLNQRHQQDEPESFYRSLGATIGLVLFFVGTTVGYTMFWFGWRTVFLAFAAGIFFIWLCGQIMVWIGQWIEARR